MTGNRFGARCRRIVGSLVATLAAGVALTGIAGTAQAASPTMNTSWTPWTSTTSQGPQYWTVSAGTPVAMRCWDTGSRQLGTSKWFYIKSSNYPFTEGYVPANAVSNQAIVGHC